jgi:hypothetical protein
MLVVARNRSVGVGLRSMRMGEQGLVLSDRSRVGVGSLLLCLMYQERVLLGEERLLLMWSQRRRLLTGPHVDGARPGALGR